MVKRTASYVKIPSKKKSPDFPMATGDLLIVRNAAGKVIERYEVGQFSHTDLSEKRVFDAERVVFNR